MGIEAKAVIGCNYGDEGKGLVTDYLAHEAIKKHGNCLVVCNNGGAQRSHTVVLRDGTRHAFRHLGSGTFAGADTYLSEYFILNPIIFREEYEELFGNSETVTKIFVDNKCIVTTPYEMLLNQMLEKSRGENRYGSCGLGIWETVKRYNETKGLWRYYDFKGFDLFEITQEIKVRKAIFDRCLNGYLKSGIITEAVYREYQPFIDSSTLMHNFISDLCFMLIHTCRADVNVIRQYKSVIFENGQGLLLNADKSNPHTTPSKTGMQNIFEIEKALGGDIEVMPYYVTRSYVTRHGAGKLDFELDKSEIGNIQDDSTNIPNDWQGALRYGVLTYDVFKRIVADAKNREYSLVITHCDELQIDTNRYTGLVKLFKSYGATRECINLERK